MVDQVNLRSVGPRVDYPKAPRVCGSIPSYMEPVASVFNFAVKSYERVATSEKTRKIQHTALILGL